MLKVGDKVECIKEEEGVFIELGEEMIVHEIDEHYDILDLVLIRESDKLIQCASSKNFVKVKY